MTDKINNPQRNSLEAFNDWFYKEHYEDVYGDIEPLDKFFEVRNEWMSHNWHELRYEDDEPYVYNLSIASMCGHRHSKARDIGCSHCWDCDMDSLVDQQKEIGICPETGRKLADVERRLQEGYVSPEDDFVPDLDDIPEELKEEEVSIDELCEANNEVDVDVLMTHKDWMFMKDEKGKYYIVDMSKDCDDDGGSEIEKEGTDYIKMLKFWIENIVKDIRMLKNCYKVKKYSFNKRTRSGKVY